MLEFLVVIAIILVLASAILLLAGKFMDTSRKERAKAEMHELSLALRAYRAAFGCWPGQTQGTNDVTREGDGHIVILEALTNAPGGRVFLKAPLEVSREAKWADPWGCPYVIAMDENGDGLTEMVTTDLTTNITDTVAIMSQGPKKDYPSGRIFSWRR